MMTSQDRANLELQAWQALRSVPPEERIEILVSRFFDQPIQSSIEYEQVMRCVTREMEA